ncbi:MAG: YkvA family protein [Erysipelotrichaceae bacterium]
MDINEEMKDSKYREAYSETKLFNKILKFAKTAGTKAIYLALLLFYTLQQATTPKWAKSVIVGALGYFILPLDFIPDFIPIAGFSDDITALLSVLVAVALYVNEDTKAKARARMQVWFGSYDETKLDEIDRKIEDESA